VGEIAVACRLCGFQGPAPEHQCTASHAAQAAVKASCPHCGHFPIHQPHTCTAKTIMTTWFTSDQHFGHKNIITYSNRPFASVEEMTEELIRRHNERVAPGDTVYHVGDFSLSEKLVQPTLARLHGQHILIAGNHDRCHRTHRGWIKWLDRYRKFGFTRVSHEERLELDSGLRLLLAHIPYEIDERHGERYAEHRPKDDGLILLHGHVHEAWAVKRRMINVGVDVRNYAPISVEEIESIAIDIQRRGN